MNSLPSSSWRWYLLALVVVAADQGVKSYVDLTTPLGWSHRVTPFFNLVHVLNPGAAFSFLADAGGWQRWFFLAIALGASAWLTWLIAHATRRIDALGYSLIMGGALGNAFDRAVRGQVIDYLDFFVGGWHWAAFNLADAAITSGAAAVIFASVREARGDRKAAVSHQDVTTRPSHEKSP